MKTMTRLLLALCLPILLSGCFIYPAFETTVLSETRPEYGDPRSLVYAIEPFERREKRNPRFQALQTRLERALGEKGLRTSRDASRVTGIVFVRVKSEVIEKTYTYDEPVYRWTNRITGAHGVRDPKTGRYRVHYERTPSREYAGTRERTDTSYRHRTTLILDAWNVNTEKNLWHTELWCTTPINDEDKVLEAMIEGGKDYLLTDTFPVIYLSIDENFDGGYTATVED